jgi:hypothetical protein
MVKQKLQDILLIIKESRAAKVGILLFVIVALYLWFGPSGNFRPTYAPPQNNQAIRDDQTIEDVINAFTQDVEEMKVGLSQTRENIEETKKLVLDYDNRTAKIFQRMLEKITDAESRIDELSRKESPAPVLAPGEPAPLEGGETLPQEDTTELESFGSVDEKEPEPATPIALNRAAFIGPGDSVRVKLLSGVNAPTDGTPYPVVFKLVSDVVGPDGSKLPLGEARLIAAAQGSLLEARALFRLTSLSMSLPSGERKVFSVDGWIVGEDGIQGMPGVTIDPIGEAMAGAGMVGAIQGFGQGIAGANTQVRNDPNGGITTAINGSAGEFAVGQALTQAGSQWQQILTRRLSELVPVVQVFSGREGTALFAQSVVVDGVYEANQSSLYEFASLD